MNPMQQLMFCIHDSKAEAFLNPFFLPMKAMAVREFQNMVNDPGHAFGRNPADYTLFMIGTWDGESGKVIETDTTALGNGVEFLQNPAGASNEISDDTSIRSVPAG